LDRLTGPAEARSTTDLASGAAATGAALSPASARLAAAQKTDINQRRDGAGIRELSFTAEGVLTANESSGCARQARNATY
jgi:hypothetical protein